MSNNWQNLRPWNGSQNIAFEELCCQLARYEQVPSGSVFIRKAAPDAGVECFWQLPTGDEWGWQSKFFLSPPNASQWQQLDQSVKKALEKHQRLTTYTICLPIDRQDPRLSGQQWFMDKWNEHVGTWQTWAREKGMPVEFTYWGEHEIWERLSREEHRGRCFFWFNEELFSDAWFKARLEEAIANAGPRYTPELNVDLPIACLFDGLSRTTDFYTRIKALYGDIKRAYTKATSQKARDTAADEFRSLQENITPLLSTLAAVDETEVNPINWSSLATLAASVIEIIWSCLTILEDVARRAKEKPAAQKAPSPPSHSDEFGYERHYLYQLQRHLRTLQNFGESSEACLSNRCALLLAGKAGTGKTHLLCDISKRRVNASLPTILLLGGQLNDDEPWSQVIRLLGLSCTKDELLGALEAAAQARGARALLMIDALNEGDGRRMWNKHLAGMLTTISRYPWVGIAVTVRTSYEDTVIPEGLVPQRLVREVHYGFADHEYQATKTFFDHFGIERPSIPLLVPEFGNPLFLKLFCRGLKNLGLTKIPPGLRGITAIFTFFLDSVNKKLSKPECLDFDSTSQVVQKAVDRLAELMARDGRNWLPRETTQEGVDALLPRTGYENSLFRHLIAEGLLAEDRFRTGDDNWTDGVHFSYERFADHWITNHLLKKHLDATNPAASFSPGQPLGTLTQDHLACYQNRGLIEALSVQLPELIKKELADLAPHVADHEPVRHAFVESLVWRDPEAITDATLAYVNTHVIRYQDTHDAFINALLTLAAYPGHPFNADFLHNHLMTLDLPSRDAQWSIFLHDQYGQEGSVDRLVDWAWSPEDKTHIEDEAIRLCGVTLVWFLTTAHRYLRDRATKALINLFTSRIHVLRKVIPLFLNVDDRYVLERLFAVAYGCTLRTTDTAAIRDLAKDVYDWIFKNGAPPPHILLRDYARGVIEVAVHHHVATGIDLRKVRPPYHSEWPTNIPSKEELKPYGEVKEGMPDEEWARVHLYHSVMGFEDFARYVIGTNSGLSPWSSRRLGEPKQPSQQEIYEEFVRSLTIKQKRAWGRCQEARMALSVYRYRHQLGLAKDVTEHNSAPPVTERNLEQNARESERAFRATLDRNKLAHFCKYVRPYLDAPQRYENENRFDLSLAQRWILSKVLELGWTVERFGRFDRRLTRYSDYGRAASKPERIGKKYQWIAYHEFLARVSDNFACRGGSWSGRTEPYQGPWQVGHIRDIDPSCLLRRTQREQWQAHTSTWWFPATYNAWSREPDDTKWLMASEDLPAVEPLLAVTNPQDSSQWIVMEAFYRWEQPTPPDEERYEIPRREIWYLLKSYIVKRSDMMELFEWAKTQNFIGRWMPESHETLSVFLGEFFWAPTFEYHNTPYYGHARWTRGHRPRLIPKKVLVTTDGYMWESSGYDCSIDETLHISFPCKWLADKMGLSWRGVEGAFFNAKGKLVAFDPSVTTPGPGALLIKRDTFLKFLDDNGYDVLWTLLGEKNIIGGSMSSDKHWKGRLELSGAYRINKDKIEGRYTTTYKSRNE